MLVPPLALTSEAKHLLDRPGQSLARSTSKDIAAVESNLEIWDIFTRIQFRTYIERLIHDYALGIAEVFVKSVFFRLVINLISYLLRLGMLYTLYKFILKLFRFANQYRCVCLLIPTCVSMSLYLFLVLLYLLYLRRLG